MKLLAIPFLLLFCTVVAGAEPTADEATIALKREGVTFGKIKSGGMALTINTNEGAPSKESLAGVLALPKVEMIVVSGKDCDDALANLPEIKTLREAVLYSDCSDASLKGIGKQTTLRVLSVQGRHVTDDGLKHLERCKELEVLKLNGTRCTKAGLQSLYKHLPKCVGYLEN